MNLAPFTGARRPNHAPVRSLKELAVEFRTTVRRLQGAMRVHAGPKAELVTGANRTHYYDVIAMRQWWRETEPKLKESKHAPI